MKLRKAIKVAVAGAAIAPAIAMAAAPVNFDNWTTNATSITGGTQAGFSYGESLTETGFLQRQVTDGTNTWIQTVVAEATGTDQFSDENFVLIGGTGGIADKAQITEAGAFDMTTTIYTGALKTMMDSKVNITQDQSGAGGWTAGFTFDHNMNMAGGGGMYEDVRLSGTVATAAFTGTFDMRNYAIENGNTNITNALEGRELRIGSNLADPAGTPEITQSFEKREVEGAFIAYDGNLVGSSAGTIGFTAGGIAEATTIDQNVVGAGDFTLQDLLTDLTAADKDAHVAANPTLTANYGTNAGSPFTF